MVCAYQSFESPGRGRHPDGHENADDHGTGDGAVDAQPQNADQQNHRRQRDRGQRDLDQVVDPDCLAAVEEGSAEGREQPERNREEDYPRQVIRG